MKKKQKYTLLDKEEPDKKQKEKQSWIQLQQFRRNDQGNLITNSNGAHYNKLQDDISDISSVSQVQYQVLPKKNNNSSNIKKPNPNISNKNINSQYQNRQTNNYQNNPQQVNRSGYYPQYPQYPGMQPVYNQPQNINQRQQRMAQSQMYPQNAYNNPYNAMYNRNYIPDVNYADNIDYRNIQAIRNSQMQRNYPQQVHNSNLRPYSSQMQPNSPPTNSKMRANTRLNIPQMVVNCDKCTFSQSVPGNSKLYICCMCSQMSECFPLYGVFTCGICKANVIYPYGTSEYIKCTKCLTINRVNPQPSQRKDNQQIMMGKQKQVQKKQDIQPQPKVQTKQTQQKKKMMPVKLPEREQQQKKRQYHVDFFYEQQPLQIIDKQLQKQKQKFKQNPFTKKPNTIQNPFDDKPFVDERPFKVFTNLANQKIKEESPVKVKAHQQQRILDIQPEQKVMRERESVLNFFGDQGQLINMNTDSNNKNKPEPHKSSQENIPFQILQLSQKLDNSVFIEQKQGDKIASNNKKQIEVKQHQNQQYPDLF